MCTGKRTKRAAAFLVLLLPLILPFSAHAAEIVPDEEITESRTEYVTSEAVKGEMESLNEFRNAEFLRQEEEIRYRGPDVLVIEAYVSYRQEVKAGDVLFVLRRDLPEIDIEEAERAFVRMQEAYALKCSEFEDEIASLNRQLSEAQDAVQRDLLTLSIRRKTIEYEKYRYEAERELEKSEKETAALREEKVITAPCQGIVTDVTNAKNGKTIVKDGELLCRIRHAEQLVVAVNQKNDSFPGRVHFGTEARFYVKEDGAVTEVLTGHVIASNLMREMSNVKDEAAWSLIAVDLEDRQRVSEILDQEKPVNAWNLMLYVNRKFENVLKVPAKAVHQGTDGYYVTVVGSGSTLNRRTVSVNPYHSEEEYWVIEGLSEGDTVLTGERSY